MAKIVKVPVLGQSVEEVRIIRWYKSEGDAIAKGEPLAEIETDKVNIDFESPEEGVVRKILVPTDSFVKVESPVAIVGAAGESIDHLLGSNAAPAAEAPTATTTSATVSTTTVTHSPASAASQPCSSEIVVASPRAQRAAAECSIDIQALLGRGSGPHGRVQEKDVLAYYEEVRNAPDEARAPKVTPLARAVASDAGLDLTSVSGTGAGGKILVSDVRPNTPAMATPETAAAPQPGGSSGSRVVPITGLRKRVADNIARSIRTAPHVTLNISVDMTEAMRLRKDLLPAIEKATGVRVSPTDIIVKAVAVALREMPYMNAHIDGDTLTLFDDVHVGLAVSLGEAGLIVPVIKNADRKGILALARDRQDLATRARKSELGGADISGGTFTVSSLGNFGIESFNPIINPPQVAILGVGGIKDAVVPIGGAPAIRPIMGLSLSFDHRAMDGAPAAAFLARLKEILEAPYLLLL